MKIKNLTILNKKEIKELLNEINTQWDTDLNLDAYGVMKNEKNKIFISKRETFDIDFDRLRVNSLGLYIGETEHGIRLSIEGSELIGPFAKKNILEIDEEQRTQWLKGIDLENIKTEEKLDGFIIIKNKEDYLGSGKYKEGKILNFVPKVRRINPNNKISSEEDN